MILDVTGIELIPGNNGEDCPGNGNHIDSFGMPHRQLWDAHRVLL